MNHVEHVELERLLAEVSVDDLAGRLQADGRVKFGRQVAKGDAEMVTVLRIKASIVD